MKTLLDEIAINNPAVVAHADHHPLGRLSVNKDLDQYAGPV
jgi:hypothetical protein